MRLRWMVFMLLSGLVSLTIVSAQSTEMLIIEGNPLSERNTQTLNPLFCENSSCRHIADLLFPTLLNIDAATGTLLPANAEVGLVASWEVDGNRVTYTLRDDGIWSDGTPITAYDVFFSFQLARRGSRYRFALEHHVAAAVPVDAKTIQFVFADVDCNALPQANFHIVPSHVYAADFAETLDYDNGDIATWHDRYMFPDTTPFRTSPEFSNPTVTGGTFRLAERRVGESIHLLSTDGRMAYSFVDLDSVSAADKFLRGDLNLLVEPPYNRRADLLADETTTIYHYPGNLSTFIMLNLADPADPQPAFDDAGNPVDQGVHPILGDRTIRRAMQMALDVDAIIDAVLEGDGVPLTTSLLPPALGFNPALDPIAQDVMGARQLLFDAGWRDMDGDGIRECLHCEHAETGTRLMITLDYLSPPRIEPQFDTYAIAALLQRQLRAVGMEVFLNDQPLFERIFGQRFDVVLFEFVSSEPDYLPFGDLFRQEEDVPLQGSNVSSYANPEVDRILEQADHIPDCDAATRRALLQKVEAILQADQPYLWLFSPNRMIATRQGVQSDGQFWEQFLP